MTPRDTGTGGVLEAMILPALQRGGYASAVQQRIGERLGGGVHRVDVVAEKEGKRYLVSLKWQQQGGTAEEKVPFEVISLANAVRIHRYDGAFLILGGVDHVPRDRVAKTKMIPGWKLRKFYLEGGLKGHLVDADNVEILTLEGFVAKANQGEL